MSNVLMEKLFVYAKNNLNVLLVGRHGIGKSMMVKCVAESLGLRFKYFSASTLDPSCDLVGIPVPNKETKSVEYYRPKDVEDAEFIFFDEINRAHPKILNAVLEIVQFRSINGIPLPNLKMVWAACNPVGDYNVDALDPALEDRFHVHIKMKSEVDIEYLKTVMPEHIAKIVTSWWTEDLDENQRRIFSPRRVEYLGSIIAKNIDWHDVIPLETTFPTMRLEERLRDSASSSVNFKADINFILSHPKETLEHLKKFPTASIVVANLIDNYRGEVIETDDDMFNIADVIEFLPKELIVKLFGMAWKGRKDNIIDIFAKNKVDCQKEFPKFWEVLNSES